MSSQSLRDPKSMAELYLAMGVIHIKLDELGYPHLADRLGDMMDPILEDLGPEGVKLVNEAPQAEMVNLLGHKPKTNTKASLFKTAFAIAILTLFAALFTCFQ